MCAARKKGCMKVMVGLFSMSLEAVYLLSDFNRLIERCAGASNDDTMRAQESSVDNQPIEVEELLPNASMENVQNGEIQDTESRDEEPHCVTCLWGRKKGQKPFAFS